MDHLSRTAPDVRASAPVADLMLDVFVRAAVEIVDDVGIERLSMRELGERTHYSASAVSYHVAPFDRFRTLVWQAVGRDLLRECVPTPPADHHGALLAARRLADWAAAHPRLSAFYVTRLPDPRRDLRHEPFAAHMGVPGSGDLASLPELGVAVHVAARQFQITLEFAIGVADGVSLELLAEQLLRQHEQRAYIQQLLG